MIRCFLTSIHLLELFRKLLLTKKKIQGRNFGVGVPEENKTIITS